MSDDAEVSQRIMEHADTLMEWASQAKEIAVGQAPAIAEEIVRWQIADGIIGVALGITVGVVAMLVLRKVNRSESLDSFDVAMARMLVGALFAIFSLWPAFFSAAQIIQAIVAPRLAVIEKLAKMAGGDQ